MSLQHVLSQVHMLLHEGCHLLPQLSHPGGGLEPCCAPLRLLGRRLTPGTGCAWLLAAPVGAQWPGEEWCALRMSMPGLAELLQSADSPAAATNSLSSALPCCLRVWLCIRQQSSSRSSACRCHGTCCVKTLLKLPQTCHRVGSSRECQWHMHYLQPLLPPQLHFPWAHAWQLLLPAPEPASSRPTRSGLSRAPE